MSVVITTESVSDIPCGESAKSLIGIIPVHSDGQDTFRTAAPNPYEYGIFFKSYTDRKADVVHISTGSRLSSAYRNALSAAVNNPRVTVCDSMNISGGAGLLCLLAAQKAAHTEEPLQIAGYVRSLCPKICSAYILESTEGLGKSGRYTQKNASVGGLLSLKSTVYVRDGVICGGKKYTGNGENARSRFLSDILSSKNTVGQMCFLVHNLEDGGEAQRIKSRLAENFGFRKIMCAVFGDTVGEACGKNTVGIVLCDGEGD